MIVRPAKVEDIGDILRMAQTFYRGTNYASFAELSEGDCCELVSVMMQTGVILVAVDFDRVVGMVGLAIVPFLFNVEKLIATEIVWYVDETEQGLGAGRAMMEAIEPACREKGAIAIQMMTLETSPPHAGKFYERIGYRRSETSYTKVL
jgi:GNAT superfamily N-acetyltransferase